MDTEKLQKKEQFLRKLNLSIEEIEDLQSMTIGQADCTLWKEERRKRITASNFGKICKMRPSTHCRNIVRTLLYDTFSGNQYTQWGKDHEDTAIEIFEELQNLHVEKCGFFVDPEESYLGASPDGLIGDDTIIIIISRKRERKIRFAKFEEGGIELKRNHNYYYQVQGQLHVTRRKKCYFIVWTPKGLEYELIQRDDDFWVTECREKLKNFYMNCLLPELVDPQYPQGKKIVDLRPTIDKANSKLWEEMRRKGITAYNFGRICKMTLLYDTFSENSQWGKYHKDKAIKQFEELLNLYVKKCRVFVDPEESYLGTWPDGLIGDDTIIKIICLKNKKVKRNISFGNWKEGEMKLNRNHNCYYQVQGDLHVTRRTKCYFIVWTPEDMKYELIQRDDDFWATKCHEKLKNFYMNFLLPELVDPPYPQGKKIVDLRPTIDKANSKLWKKMRRKGITAYNFGRICKMTLLYDTFSENSQWGKYHKDKAIKQFEELLNLYVKKCRVFVDPEESYLGTWPDGLIGDDTIIKIICLKNKKVKRNISFDKWEEGEMKLNRNDNCYYQVQGELHVTRRTKCYFIVWTPKDMKYELIQRDDDFWATKCHEKLKNFYMNCLLPELVNPQ